MLAPSVAFVDLETTGADPARDRIIEVGIVKVTEGRLDFEWSSLVDPGVPIPRMIQGFTGISDEMVHGAPPFSEIADEVERLLEGSLFVAHNARFDHGFLKNEFLRLGRDFQPRVLCTVKLSRALYREHHKHGLDALIARHGLGCDARHRALGDARVLWDFVQLIHAEKSADEIAAAVAKATKTPSLPSGLERTVFDALPQGPGVYLLYGDGELPLYIGKGVNVRARAQAHFAADHGGGRAARLAQEVKRIEAIETAGELGALLLEARLVKEKSPLHNRHLRRNDELCSYRFTPAAQGGVALERVELRDFDPHDLADLYGVFKSKKEAVNTLRDLAAAHGLCHRRVGLECGSGPCHAYQIKRCRGVCAGKESVASHDLRMKAALSLVKIRIWPFPASIAIREYNADTERSEWHVFDAWCHLGSVSTAVDLHEAIGARDAPVFDLDTYRILKRELERRANTLEITRLDTE